MRFIYTLLLSFVLLPAFSQIRQNVYFYRNDGKRVSVKDSADFTRIIREPEPGSKYYPVSDYYMNGKVKLLGYSSTIDPVKFEGQCLTFYQNGKKNEVLHYAKGYLANQQFYYHNNGAFKEERNYVEDPKDRELIFDRLYLINNYADSSGNFMVKDGNGRYKIFKDHKYSKAIISSISEGEVKNGLKHGLWQVSVNLDSIRLEETYDNGKFISGKATHEDGAMFTYDEPDRLPDFKGGMKGFGAYLSSMLRYPAGAQSRGIQGRVNVTFNVETDGSLANVRTEGAVPSDDLGKEALRVISKSPKWIPGRVFGRIAKVSYTVPIVFSLR